MDAQTSGTRLDEARAEALQAEYERIFADGEANGAGSKFVRMFGRYVDGLWRQMVPLAAISGRSMRNLTVLDFGCKFGQLTPIFMAMGARRVISVDIDEEYLRDGNRIIAPIYGSTYVRSDDCFLNVESNSVDFILASEVISHVHPNLLYTFYSEAARVLRPGGEILISDGNNFANLETKLKVLENYVQWDQGASRELGSNYERQREKLIQKHFPELDDDRIAFFARNCSGMHGERLVQSIRSALVTGEFIERPYRPGQVPVHPSYGVVMERGFHPIQVEFALAEHGIRAVQIRQDGSGDPIESEEERGDDALFVVRGTKLPDTLESREELARERYALRL